MDSATRRFVIERALDRCEYCLIPQSGFTMWTFHVDHIDAQQHIVDDTTDNLALTCPDCNLAKGPNIATYDEHRNLIRLFHPRRDRWEDHFSMVDGIIEGTTDIGRAMVRLLDLNSARRVNLRRLLIED